MVFHQKQLGENSYSFSLIDIHVFMLHSNFELILVEIRIFINFLSYSKIRPKSLYYSTGTLAKFHQKLKGEESLFL